MSSKKEVAWHVIATAVLLAVAVLWLCVANFRTGAFGRQALKAGLRWPPQVIESRGEVRAFLHTQTRTQMPTGNIWVQFAGFEPELSEDESYMSSVYFGGNYDIYPRRLFVSAPSMVVNSGRVMAQQNVQLTRSMAERLEIDWRVTFTRDELGRTSATVERLE